MALMDLQGQFIKLTFPYRPWIIEVIKQHTTGGRFKRVKKGQGESYWLIPLSYYGILTQKLGFFEISEQLRLEMRRRSVWDPSDNELKIDGLLRPLRQYQIQGAEFLLKSGRALLADDVGLGKSGQAIAAALSVPNCNKVLIVCPASLKFNWMQEIAHWIEAPVVVIQGDKKQRLEQWRTSAQFFIVSYETMSNDFDKIDGFSVAIFDECSYLKSYVAKRTDSAMRLNIPFAFALSGTPMINRYEELHSVAYFLDPYVAGSPFEFRRDYCDLGYFDQVVGYHDIETFMSNISGIYLRRIKSELLSELPPKIDYDVYLEMEEDQDKIYRMYVKAFLEHLQDSELSGLSSMNVLTRLLRLRQLCDDPRLLGHDVSSVKMDFLIRELQKNAGKTLVFTSFSQMARLIAEDPAILQYNPLLLTGDTPLKERLPIVQKLNEDPEHRCLILTEAGTYGLNIIGASNVIHYDNPWNPAIKMQRDGRAHRMGQKEVVTSKTLIVAHSVDEHVNRLLDKKRRLAEVIREIKLEDLL